MNKKISHIVGLSGGKDSTALAIRLKELNPDANYLYVCTPTGDELPEMETHWNNLECILNQPIIKVHHPDYESIYDLIDDFKMLPNFRARWCTRILKIEAIEHFYNKMKPAIVYIGLRADEQNRKGNTLFDDQIKQSFPMQEWGWGISEVHKYLAKKKISIPARTDCAMCFYQRIGEWWNLWKYYPDYFRKISDIEDKLEHTLLSPGKWGGRWPEKLSDLSIEFKKGRIPRGANDHYKMFENEANNNKCRMCSL
jgi:3'-phosphoadenosine 5'-phosphosulfate sulfotransferase (PAPS reductase)/FAD synthetase